MRSLDQILERRRLIAVVSILRDKEALEMMRAPGSPLRHHLRHPELEPPGSIRRTSWPPSSRGLGKGPEVFVDPDPRSAMVSAYRLATSNQVVLVTGSLTLISDLKRMTAWPSEAHVASGDPCCARIAVVVFASVWLRAARVLI